MLRPTHQRGLCVGRFVGMARIADVLKTEPVSQHHHHAGGRGVQLAGVIAQGPGAGHAVQQALDGVGLVF